MSTAIISKRSRNLGYGWKTGAHDSASGWYIDAPAAPSAVGGLRSVLNEMANRHRICGHSTYYNDALFVGGRRVVSYRVSDRYDFREVDLAELINTLRDSDCESVEVRLAD